MKSIFFIPSALFIISLSSCSETKENTASGSFEAEEIIISAETNGPILNLSINEGELVAAKNIVGIIDTTPLFLKKQQVDAQIEALSAKEPNIPVQLDVLRANLKTLTHERSRTQKLVAAQAAPAKQLDDIEAQIQSIERQIVAQNATLSNTSNGIQKEIQSLRVQKEQIQDQINRCYIKTPIKGVILDKITESSELAAPGKPLFKMAALDTLVLRVYVTSNQLSLLKLNQSIGVRTDDGKGGFSQYKGTITWISSQAEFTPKTIQTQNERANLVYAIKVKVANSGNLKIGMYGEIIWK
jgi:HlyD family secretion protein